MEDTEAMSSIDIPVAFVFCLFSLALRGGVPRGVARGVRNVAARLTKRADCPATVTRPAPARGRRCVMVTKLVSLPSHPYSKSVSSALDFWPVALLVICTQEA